MTYTHTVCSPIGMLTIASEGQHITGLWIEDQKHFGRTLQEPAADGGQLPVIRDTVLWLEGYFAGKEESCGHIPLRPEGTAFQQQVWSLLRQIPRGKTLTYGQLSRNLAGEGAVSTMSARAVGNAVGKNPISILIPCHRVIGAGGKLTGYAAGTDKKRFLLELEKAI